MKHTKYLLIFLTTTILLGQFGQNIVQYDNFDWKYLQSKHFDIYYYANGKSHAEFTAIESERAYDKISSRLNWDLKNRVSIIVYNSHNDFQQTNVVDSYMYEGIGGVTELFKNRVVIPFDGSNKEFKHVIHHELVHAFVTDCVYGGNLQSLITRQIKFSIPMWMNEGLAEYLASRWDTNSDMWMRDLAINGGELPPIEFLYGYMAYRGGQSVWKFITEKWGEESIAEIFYQIKRTKSVIKGIKKALGLDMKELSEQWHTYLKKEYWSDISTRSSLKDIARQLTDHEELKNSYNVAPAISPDGGRIAIFSNKSGSMALYLISVDDGNFIKKVIQGERTAEFEELHILKPGISWSPDGSKIAFAGKSGKSDALFIVDVASGSHQKFRFDMEGIFRPAWNPIHNEIAFIGNNGITSDIYLFDLKSESLTNLTDDWFTDDQISWTPNGESLLFISDRNGVLNQKYPEEIELHNIDQTDIYKINRDSKLITRLTNTPYNETYPLISQDEQSIIYISDESGIHNIYIQNDTLTHPKPITNALTGITQLTWSKDNSALLFSGMEKSGYDIYLMSNPLDKISDSLTVELAKWKSQKEVSSLFTREDLIRDTNGDVSYENYIFSEYAQSHPDTTSHKVELTEETTQDSAGNFISHNYKTKFTLDLIQGYFYYSTMYNPEAMAFFMFSDMLGDHKIYLATEMQISLKNSNYYLLYRYLPNKLDINFQLYHNADIYPYSYDEAIRLRQLGLGTYLSYPLSRFQRFESGLDYRYVEQAELEVDWDGAVKDSIIDYLNVAIPSVGYVWDNTIWSQTYPVSGSRMFLKYEMSPKLFDSSLDFQTITFDLRKYFNAGRGISFAARLYAGTSWGDNAEKFRVGGLPWAVSNETDYYSSTPDYDNILQEIFFTKYVMPVRGAQINERFGEHTLLINAEMRFPFLVYYFPTIKYIGQISAVIFSDIGLAWDGQYPQYWEDESWKSSPKDFVWTYGFGPRFIFLGMPWKLDYAWEFNPTKKTKRMWYLSIGLDF
ncbi:MAG: PD40 domain-containing protein [Candidatus Marinimicrobia bacterium]|nr:PD40 domain-containing protein [Candidatus Neomarinimicrobiota bacterium]MBL7022559.1 PD40 domain-containing protein [Candidatus Neomarinimicrobiota bacterium]MBL7108915.1 PD40 domain-containing protein [Candidatus Neomarinimicrobiota bacterium]